MCSSLAGAAMGGSPRSSRPRAHGLAAVALGLLLLLLLFQLAITAHAKRYNVGGAYHTWKRPPVTFSFQTWADGITWCGGDVLDFTYDTSEHDVWAFEDQASFDTCNFSGPNVLGFDTLKAVGLPQDPGTWCTAHFGSSKADDCRSNMKFALTFYTGSSSGAEPPPPPPTLTRAMLTAPLSSSSLRPVDRSEKKTVPVAAIAVPAAVVLVLVVGVVGFCCVYRARRRAEADVGQSKPSPHSPVLSPTHGPVPASTHGPVPAPTHGLGPNNGHRRTKKRTIV